MGSRSNSRRHVKLRASERFGVTLNRQDMMNIERMITEGKSSPYKKSTNGTGYHKLCYAGLWMRVVYSKTHKTIKTVMK